MFRFSSGTLYSSWTCLCSRGHYGEPANTCSLSCRSGHPLVSLFREIGNLARIGKARRLGRVWKKLRRADVSGRRGRGSRRHRHLGPLCSVPTASLRRYLFLRERTRSFRRGQSVVPAFRVSAWRLGRSQLNHRTSGPRNQVAL
jgi:hypothetical protein